MAKRIIKQPQIDPHIMKLLGDYFVAKHDVLLSFLFGSYVSKKMNAFSDIDIGVLFSKYPGIYAINDIKEDLTGLLKKNIDLVALNEASPIIRMQIIKKGVIVFQRHKNEFSIFYGNTVKQYDDLKIIRKKCEDNILKGRIYA